MKADERSGAVGCLRVHGMVARSLKAGLAVSVALVVANCGSANVSQGRRSSEIGAFSDKKYGTASPRVVAEGEPVPKGGGRDLIGRTYSVAGRTYTPFEKRPGHTEVGYASWYGEAFHGRRTANGEVYDRFAVTAAHRTMPLPSYARVTNTRNGRSIIVRVNDRGPFHSNRLIDVSMRVAEALDFKRSGTGRVKVDYIGRASLRGSDDNKLLATLRTDGMPATGVGPMEPAEAPVMVASAQPKQERGFLGFAAAPKPEPASPPFVQQASYTAPAASAPREDEESAAQETSAQETRIHETPAPRQQPAGRIVHGIPTPPDRPFDLATIPNAGTPVPPSRPGRAITASHAKGQATASLFFAEPASVKAHFVKNDPWSRLKPQKFQPLSVSQL